MSKEIERHNAIVLELRAEIMKAIRQGNALPHRRGGNNDGEKTDAPA